MYVYVHYENNQPNGLAFNKEEKAVEYVIEKIEENIGVRQKKEPVKVEQKKSKKPYGNRFTIPLTQPPTPVAAEQIYEFLPDYLEVPPPLQRHSISSRYSQLKESLDGPPSNKDTDPKYLLAVQEQITITNANKTLENAKKLIEQYDIYMKNTSNIDCPLHTIQEIGMVDVKI